MFSFYKMQGTGNDFIVLDCIDNKFEYSLPVLSKYLCDRHYGVGADGVILIYESEIADFKMKIFNHDGTEAEMCGNGIRCFAKYVYEKNRINKTEFLIETLAGIKKVKLNLENEKVLSVQVNMGEPQISNLKHLVEIDKIQYLLYPVSIGNPHAVCFVEDVENVDVEKIGPILENYKYFPNKTNVEFVKIIDKANIEVRVWERGVGETLSCGTGACAAGVISVIKKSTDCDLTVDLKGGKLKISYDKENNNVKLIGSAEFVYDGKIDI